MCQTAPRRQRGFTLIDLMIAVSVVGVLSSVALPSFEGQLRKARRADVLVATMQVQAAQERFRGNMPSYASLPEIGLPETSPSGHYRLSMAEVTADGYELRATAIGSQARDAACRHMTLSSSRLLLVHASGPDATLGNPAELNRKCWNL